MTSPITSQSSVARLAELWLQQLRTEGRLDGTTIDEYARVLRKLVIPRLGGVSLRELMTDTEPARPTALAAQVVMGLNADTKLRGELGQGEDGA